MRLSPYGASAETLHKFEHSHHGRLVKSSVDAHWHPESHPRVLSGFTIPPLPFPGIAAIHAHGDLGSPPAVEGQRGPPAELAYRRVVKGRAGPAPGQPCAGTGRVRVAMTRTWRRVRAGLGLAQSPYLRGPLPCEWQVRSGRVAT